MSATVEQIQTTIRQLRTAQARLAQSHRTEQIVEAIARAAQSWLPESSPWRTQAVERASVVTGFSTAMINEIITRIFAPITVEALNALLDRELGDRRALDEFRPHGAARARAYGPYLITHVLSGNVPAPGVLSIIYGLLLKSRNLVKMSSNDPVFPSLFVESLRAVDSELGACVAALEWPRTETAVTLAALAEADAVIGYGDDNTITALRQVVPSNAKFLGYGQKMSFGFIAKEAMTEANLPSLAALAAEDVSVYDQQGCLSSHLFFVEERGALEPQKFAAALAEAMATFQARIPRGTLTVEEAMAVNLTRSTYEFRAASDRRVAVWASHGQNDWAVIYEEEPSLTLSCLNRVVFVKPVTSAAQVIESVQRHAAQISTVGIAPMSDAMMPFAAELGKLGVHRVCAIGQMQRPPLCWYHDGRPNIAELVRWTEIN